jgi:chaperone modulatory protein CbpM
MIPDIGEATWLDRDERVAIADLAAHSGFTEEEVRELVDYGALAPVDAAHSTFTAECMVILRRAARLKDDFELDNQALVLALALLERIGDLESQLAEVRARLPHRAA